MKNPYDDIIHLPHHVSRNHPQMSMLDRAAQFSPFAALTGYEDAVAETGRLTEPRRELDAAELDELNKRFALLALHLAEHPEVSIELFVPDERKDGGSYRTVSGVVKKICKPERKIFMLDGFTIRIDDVFSLNGIFFKEFEKK